MIDEIKYLPIEAMLDIVYKNDLLHDVTLEDVVQYTRDFFGIFNLTRFYTVKVAALKIQDYRAKLPCDLVSINQVRDCHTKLCLKAGTGYFGPSKLEEPSFYTQNSILYTSFRDGDVEISYKALPTDNDGNILILDNVKFKRALELYITKEKFNKLYQRDKLSRDKLDRVEQQYAWAAGQMSNSFKMPSLSEAESITNSNNQFLLKKHEFQKGFSTLGNEEHIKIHR